MDSPTRDRIDIRSSRAPPKTSKDKRKAQGYIGRRKEREQEKFSQLSAGSLVSSRLSALADRGSQLGEKLARFATDRHASRNLTCFLSASTLASILSRTIFRSSPALHQFSTVAVRLLTRVSPHPAHDVAFPDLPQTTWIFENGDTEWIVKVSLSDRRSSSFDRLI